uniref:CCHC-type domain-containing protein n=1 Tax=Strongyloides venezuelensis TaxID=75913 RepID=A0A0K0F531_STRVS
MQIVTSVNAFLKSELKRMILVGKFDKRKLLVQCNHCKFNGHRESECNKELGNCFSCGSKDHKVKECPKKLVGADLREDSRRVSKLAATGGLLIEMKICDNESKISFYLCFLDSG